MLDRSLPLFRPFGIEIGVHWTWLILAALVASSLATGWFPALSPAEPGWAYWVAGVLGAIGLFTSIVIHEFCHAIVGRSHNLPMTKITLFLFGGVAHMDEEPATPKAEFQMAIAGPIASIVLAGVFYGFFATAVALSWPLLMQALLSYLASINVVVAIFNMLPGYPLDGGRVLRSALWYLKGDIMWATRIAAGIGQAFGFALAVFGVVILFSGQGVSGLWSVFLGLLLATFARSSYVQLLVKQALHGKPAANFMNSEPVTVHPETPVDELMRESLRHSDDQTIYPVVSNDREREFVGCVDLRRLKQFPEEQWHDHRVSEITQSCTADMQITPETDAETALNRMSKTGNRALIIVQGTRLMGVLTQNALVRYLRLREA